MDVKFLKKIRHLYEKSDQLLISGRFGEGLWPIDPFLGQFLQQLISAYGLKNGAEIGAGVGYSSGWLVSGFLETGGQLTSLEYFPPKVEQWGKNMKYLFGVQFDEFVQIVASDFRKWIHHSGRKKFDFVLLDHRKNEYLESLLLLLPRLKRGAFICADNVLSHERACKDYLDFVRSDDRFQSFCVPIAQGLEVTRFLPST